LLELHSNELVALLFEPINDLTREAALHAVRLDPEKKTRTGERGREGRRRRRRQTEEGKRA
jgi:hypothetical protein